MFYDNKYYHDNMDYDNIDKNRNNNLLDDYINKEMQSYIMTSVIGISML